MNHADETASRSDARKQIVISGILCLLLFSNFRDATGIIYFDHVAGQFASRDQFVPRANAFVHIYDKRRKQVGLSMRTIARYDKGSLYVVSLYLIG